MGSFAIQPAGVGDLPNLPRIEREAASLFAGWQVPHSVLEEQTPLDEFAAAQREGRLWVARDRDDGVVGFALVELVGGAPHLEEIDVLPSHGRRGIGRALVQAVSSWAQLSGFTSLSLTTFRDIPWNAPFYRRLGFSEVAHDEINAALQAVVRDEASRGLDPSRRVVMSRSLAPGALPPGQVECEEFPRFGWGNLAFRFPSDTASIEIAVRGDVDVPLTVGPELASLPRVEQVSDLHCVTTWSKRRLRWSGFRFRDFFETIVEQKVTRRPGADLVVLRAQDGYSQSLPLEDLLAPDVLLADRLDGDPLSIAHGAPIRLVAPAHYGYKNVKHLCSVEFWRDARAYRFIGPKFMDHPRARVALEERGVGVPAWILRRIYPPMIPPVRWMFRFALERHEARKRKP